MANEPNGSADWNPPDNGLTLDELFPNPELASQGPASGTQDAPQTHEEYFLKAGTGTVYKTVEDAVRGTEEKDRTIERMKSELEQLKRQQPQASQTTAPPQNPTAYKKAVFKRLAEAAQAGNEEAYVDTLAEIQMATLSQFAPALTGVYEQQAIQSVSTEAKDFGSWLHGPEYSRTLEQFPALANAIQTAKSDPRAAGQLTEFYRLAYRAYAGDPARINQVVTDVARTSAAPAVTPPRPTLQSSTPTPVPTNLPQRSPQLTREQILSDRNARTEFLKRFREERGAAMEARFGDIGL
jgi:hypothetical protein